MTKYLFQTILDLCNLRALCICDIITSGTHEIHLPCDMALSKLIVAQRSLVGKFANVKLT